MIMNDEISANAIMKRATKHYIVVIQPIEKPYLETVLLYMPDYKNEPEGIEELMPWSDMIQQRCRIKSKS